LPSAPTEAVADRLGRPLRDLRVSVTDRCNFRCTYCMPREVFGAAHPFLPRAEILSYEEIARLVRIAARLGVRKIRLTGGEPLLRRDLPELVMMLRAVGGLDLALTTNGALLERSASVLADAGLDRVTVSLDALDPEIFQRMSDTRVAVGTVLAGVEAAQTAGLGPIKVNCVVQRGVNEQEIPKLAQHFRGTGVVVRFIEYMDVGSTNGWRLDEVVPATEILQRLQEVAELVPVDAGYRGEVARRWCWADGAGEVGLITSVSTPFCGDCSRARLSADGHLYTCLFASAGTDLRPALRGGGGDQNLEELLRSIWSHREDRYSELRGEAGGAAPKVEMSAIGG
jgi:cyclic pyranopterin phosphate synthase